MKTHKLCIAPMMEWTDRHYRFLVRLMTRHTRLYTEMVTTGALIHGDRQRFLQFDSSEHPVALQLGGSHPADMAQAAKWGEQAGYDEININVGCPSQRVQAGCFGVSLMRQPELVAECVDTIHNQVSIPVTVKCRIGVDEHDSYEFLYSFVNSIVDAGCQTLIIHARKAWLKGLNPKQNREIPPLDYSRVYQLKHDYPDLNIVINGGIGSIDEIHHHLKIVDGVMIGRHAYHQPAFLINVDQLIFNETQCCAITVNDVVEKYALYVENNIRQGVPLKAMTKHLLNVFQGIPGAKKWRRHLSENMHKPDSSTDLIYQGLEMIN